MSAVSASEDAPAVGAREAGLVAAIVAVGAFLRFASLNAASFWLDESYTVTAVRGSLGGVWHAVVHTESTPPLYYWLAWLWTQAFGDGEVGVRSLSALAGTATVFAVWLAGRELLSARAAAIGAALVAVSPLLVWYSQEARAYALVVLLCTLAFWCFLRARRGARHAVAWWALAGALAMTTSYIAVFPVAAEAVLLLWRRRDRATALVVVVVGVVGLALLPLLVTQRGNPLAGALPGGVGHRTAQLLKQLAVGFDGPAENLLGAVAIAVAIVGGALAFAIGRPAERRAATLLAGVAAVSLLAPFALLAVGEDQVLARYVLPALPLLLLVVATGFAAVRPSALGLALAGLVALVGAVTVVAVAVTPDLRTREDWRGAVQALGPGVRPRAFVATPNSALYPLRLYAPGLESRNGVPITIREVDLLDVTPKAERHLTRVQPVLPHAPAFRLVGARTTSTYAVRRYLAPRPTTVTLRALRLDRADPAASAVFLQP